MKALLLSAGTALSGRAAAQSRPAGLPTIGVKADSGPLRSESGVGALMPWADVLWATTYTSFGAKRGSGTGLYEVDENLNIRQRHISNGTYANRFTHSQSNQVIIGPYVIGMNGNVRIATQLLDERLTATMTHLTDPANRVYMLSMEGLFYEMDVSTLKAKLLGDLVKEFGIREPPHFKGGYTGQDRVVVANNTYTAWGQRDGLLAEWDGKKWTAIERKPFMEAAGQPKLGSAVFATGWDEASALLKVLIDGKWVTYRLPKATHSFDERITTEWTRIREVETERYLMDCHGLFYELPLMVFEKSVWGVIPICQHLRVVPDFCSFRGLLVLGGNEQSSSQDRNVLGGQPQSGIWFGKTDDLWQFGKQRGWGGPWRKQKLNAGEVSDPFLMTGFDKKVLHIVQSGAASAGFTVEIDFLGDGSWQKYDVMRVGSGVYKYHVFPEGFSAHWLRLTADEACTATAELFYT